MWKTWGGPHRVASDLRARRAVLRLLATGASLAGAMSIGRRASAVERVGVEIADYRFSPATLMIAAGTEVMWLNVDDDPHTIVSASIPPLFKSPALDTDETYGFVFTEPGAYAYFCTVHPYMTGRVVVT